MCDWLQVSRIPFGERLKNKGIFEAIKCFPKYLQGFNLRCIHFTLKHFVLLLSSFLIQLNYLTEQSHDQLETKRWRHGLFISHDSYGLGSFQHSLSHAIVHSLKKKKKKNENLCNVTYRNKCEWKWTIKFCPKTPAIIWSFVFKN